MTGAAIVGGLILLAVAALAWARISAARAERRSIDGYGRALGALGEVARRSEFSGNVRIIPRENAGENAGVAHVRTGAAESELLPDIPSAAAHATDGTARLAVGDVGEGRDDTVPGVAREVLPVRATLPSASPVPVDRPVLSVLPRTPRISLPVSGRPLRFVDDTLEAADASEPRLVGPASPDGVATQAILRRRQATERRRQATELGRQAALRRATTGSAAVLALVLAVVGTLQLTGGGHHAALTTGGQKPARPANHSGGAVSGQSGQSGQSSQSGQAGQSSQSAQHPNAGAGLAVGAQHNLVPTSTTSSEVSFQVPSRKYLLTFSDSGASDCWVGVETAAGSNVWLWSETLAPGSTTSYQASRPVVVVLGAPRNIEVRVNGVAAELPAYALSYDLSFTTGTASA